MLSESMVLAFVCRLQRAYLVERDIRTVLSNLDEEVEWIGTGEKERGQGIANAARYLEREYSQSPGSFNIIEENYTVKLLSETVATVFGDLTVQENGREEIIESQRIRLTAVLREQDGDIRVKQVHMSAGSIFQLDGESFPRSMSGRNIGNLLLLLDEQAVRLREQNDDLNALMENVPGGVMCCEFNDELKLLQYSQGFLDMFGYSRAEIEEEFHNNFRDLICPEDLEAAWKSVLEQLEKGKFKQIEYRVRCRDGGLVAVLDHGQLVERQGKKVFYCILTDITESRKLLEELRLSLERHRIIMEQTNDIFFEWNLTDDSIFFSDNWEKKFGYHPITESVSAMIRLGHIHPDDLPVAQQLMRDVMNHMPEGETKLRIAKADGTYLWCRIRVKLQENRHQNRPKAIGVISDIDKEIRNVNMLLEKAQNDALTGLYNKSATSELGGRYIERATPEQPCGFIIIDLDNFKYINDVYGHLSGDLLLSDIAMLLKRIFRFGDIVGRIGGDEFVAILPGNCTREVVEAKFDRIREKMEELLDRDGYMLSCSAGIAFAPMDGEDYQTLYRKADSALYQAKQLGKNQLVFYEDILESEGKVKTNCIIHRNAGAEERSKQTLAEYILTVLQREEDVERAILQVLEIVGRQFGVSRAYIFEDSGDGATCSNTYEWCKEGVKPQKAWLQEIEYTEGNRYGELFDENGIFYCRDIDKLPDRTKEILAPQEIKSMLQCLLVHRKEKFGFIGFDQCWEKRVWTLEQISALSLISGTVGVFLTQLKLERMVKKLKEEIKEPDV